MIKKLKSNQIYLFIYFEEWFNVLNMYFLKSTFLIFVCKNKSQSLRTLRRRI